MGETKIISKNIIAELSKKKTAGKRKAAPRKSVGKAVKNSAAEDIFKKKDALEESVAARSDEATEAPKAKKVIAPARKISFNFANYKKAILVALVIFLVAGAAGGGYYAYQKSKDKEAEIPEVEKLIQKIGVFMELPTGENPTLATVTDKEKVKNQPFFAKAENGDKVLIYTQSKKAVLYRPATNKVIESMYLAINETKDASSEQAAATDQQQTKAEDIKKADAQSEGSSASQAETSTEKIKVAVYNGTDIKGRAADLAEQILKIEGMDVVKKTNASGSYEKTIVIDLGGKNAEAQRIAQSLGGEVVPMPAGEAKPEADILVIAGK